MKNCIQRKEDDYTRCVVGLLADISNYTPNVMTNYMSRFELDIIEIMRDQDFSFETKVGAIQSLGDILMGATTYRD